MNHFDNKKIATSAQSNHQREGLLDLPQAITITIKQRARKGLLLGDLIPTCLATVFCTNTTTSSRLNPQVGVELYHAIAQKLLKSHLISSEIC